MTGILGENQPFCPFLRVGIALNSNICQHCAVKKMRQLSPPPTFYYVFRFHHLLGLLQQCTNYIAHRTHTL